MEVILETTDKEYENAFDSVLDERNDPPDSSLLDLFQQSDDDGSYVTNTEPETPRSTVSMAHFEDDEISLASKSVSTTLSKNETLGDKMQSTTTTKRVAKVSDQRRETNRISAMRSRALRNARIAEDHQTIRRLQQRLQEVIKTQSLLCNCVRNVSNHFLQASTAQVFPTVNDMQFMMDSVSDILAETHDKILEVTSDPVLVYNPDRSTPSVHQLASKSVQESLGMSGSSTLSSAAAGKPPRRR